ncbi:hypothetical protein pb186bvf_009814 [Paramecium bursaria]
MNKNEDSESQPILGNRDVLAQDWEGFKRNYYNEENQLQSKFKLISDINNEITKKLNQLEKSEPICEADEIENRRKYQSIDMHKFQLLLDDLDESMISMKGVLQNMVIDPEEPQLKLKTNILKRFREIHQDHEKEYLKINQSYQQNQKKYDLFQEAIRSGGGQQFKIKSKDLALNKKLSQQLDQADMTIDMANQIHQNLQFQTMKISGIHDKVQSFMGIKYYMIIGQFDSIGGLIKGINYHKQKAQIILILALVLLIYIFMF